MNLIPARATPNGRGSVIEIARDGDEPLRLHEPRHAGLAGDILLGLRPRRYARSAPPARVEALQGGAVRVDVVEPAGADTYVVAKLGGKEVTSRLSADTPARGQAKRWSSGSTCRKRLISHPILVKRLGLGSLAFLPSMRANGGA